MNALKSSVDKVRENLISANIGEGSALLIHSGIGEICTQNGHEKFGQIEYAIAIIDMLIDLVGTNGTIMMSTDSISDPFDFAYKKQVFDPKRMRSRRGIISEVFRLHSGSIRSHHPWCNATAWGKHAEWLMEDHLKSTPFAMDQNSPWYKLNEIDAHIVYLGVTPGNACQSSVVPESVLGYDYPVGVHFDKPLVMRCLTPSADIAEVPVLLHVHDWQKHEMTAFFLHLDQNYGLHKRHGTKAEQLIICKAKFQYDVIMTELEKGHPFIHARYWL
jgi:hypothetical protein